MSLILVIEETLIYFTKVVKSKVYALPMTKDWSGIFEFATTVYASLSRVLSLKVTLIDKES